MIKHYGLVVLILVLLFLTGCSSSSEAKINVYNNGELSIKVTIYYSTMEIAPGKREGFTLHLARKGRHARQHGLLSGRPAGAFPVPGPGIEQGRCTRSQRGIRQELKIIPWMFRIA